MSSVIQEKGALNGAQHAAVFSSTDGGNQSPRGETSDGVGLVLPLGPGRGLREVQIQVSRHQRVPWSHKASQALGRLMPHWGTRKALERRTTRCCLAQAHIGRARLAVLLALPTEPRAREPPDGQRERTSGDPAEEGCRGSVNLVGVRTPRHVQLFSDVP